MDFHLGMAILFLSTNQFRCFSHLNLLFPTPLVNKLNHQISYQFLLPLSILTRDPNVVSLPYYPAFSYFSGP